MYGSSVVLCCAMRDGRPDRVALRLCYVCAVFHGECVAVFCCELCGARRVAKRVYVCGSWITTKRMCVCLAPLPTSSRINVRKRRARGALGHVGGAATDCCGDVCLRVQGFAATWVGLCV